jgi:PHD/YefM family antitoxin component YafN of YafNO toxin-antitoxin module
MDRTCLPIGGELQPALCEAVAGGQPIAVVDTQGRPVAILLDIDSYAEMEEAALTAGASG